MSPLHTAISVSVAAGFTAGGFTYAGRWPGSQIFGKTLQPSDDPNQVALTYDDGPSPANTPQLLDLLAEFGVHATFFLLGDHVRRHPQLARRVVEAGHTVGNHTQTHPSLLFCSPAHVRSELETCQQTIFDTTGVQARIFRPPFGSRRPDVLQTARVMGLIPALWNVSSVDWRGQGAERILSRIDRSIASNQRRQRASNILLHDASHLDTVVEAHSRHATIEVTRRLLMRPGFSFTMLAAWL